MREAERRDMLRAWQLSDEKYDKDVRKFKTSNFVTEMIWDSFVYERKRSIYFEYEETQKKKRRLQHLLDLENQKKQLAHYLIFASLLALRELKAEEKGKKKPDFVSQLSVNLRNNIKTRSDRTKEHDVDWLRHRKESLSLLFDFVKELMKKRRQSIVLEDEISSHACRWIDQIFWQHEIQKIKNWSLCSPDLNLIEKAWLWMRRWIDKQAFASNSTRKQTEELWRQAWKALSQSLINKWINDILKLLQKIIDCDGDNNFEG